jgi:nicotinamidase/pyrazinamidase
MKKALIIVDIQNDFCNNGSLEVPDADSIIQSVNQLMESNEYDKIIASLDWHPKDHKSFASNNNKKFGDIIILEGIQQFMWSDHCIQYTKGAELHKDLNSNKIDFKVTKGLNVNVDSYSAFFDNNKTSATGLNEFLKLHKITEVDIVGLALDYCVKATALDAVNLGYKTNIILKATKSVSQDSNVIGEVITELVLSNVNCLD